jgi:hypothetical protein
MQARKFIKILDKLDARKFRTLKGGFQAKLDTFYWNLWHQFGVTPEYVKQYKIENKGTDLSVSDFAWTDKAKAAFYAHPKHQKFWKLLSRSSMDKGMWGLQAEPTDYDEYMQYVARATAEEAQRASGNNAQGTVRVDDDTLGNAPKLRKGKTPAA